MATRVELELSDEAITVLDQAIASGHFASRAAALEDGLRRALDAVDASDTYARAYASSPEDERYGEVGLRLIEQRLGDDRSR